MGPRLHLVWKLLADHRVCFVSIKDVELFRLAMLMDEIFLERNRVGVLVERAIDNNPTRIVAEHEYVLVYAKNKDLVDRIWTGEQRRSRAPVGLPSSPMTPVRGDPVVQGAGASAARGFPLDRGQRQRLLLKTAPPIAPTARRPAPPAKRRPPEAEGGVEEAVSVAVVASAVVPWLDDIASPPTELRAGAVTS